MSFKFVALAIPEILGKIITENVQYTWQSYHSDEKDANRQCKNKFQWESAPSLLTPESRKFIMAVLSKHRFEYRMSTKFVYHVAVSLKRFKTEDKYLNWWYKFMWWDYFNKIISYEPSLYQYEPELVFQANNKNRFNYFDPHFSYDTSVVLKLLPSGKMRFTKLSIHREKNTRISRLSWWEWRFKFTFVCFCLRHWFCNEWQE